MRFEDNENVLVVTSVLFETFRRLLIRIRSQSRGERTAARSVGVATGLFQPRKAFEGVLVPVGGLVETSVPKQRVAVLQQLVQEDEAGKLI